MPPGVSKAVANVNTVIGPELIKAGLKVTSQKDIDDFLIRLDGTANKGKLGANAILGVSIAVAEAGAAEKVCSMLESGTFGTNLGFLCRVCRCINTWLTLLVLNPLSYCPHRRLT